MISLLESLSNLSVFLTPLCKRKERVALYYYTKLFSGCLFVIFLGVDLESHYWRISMCEFVCVFCCVFCCVCSELSFELVFKLEVDHRCHRGGATESVEQSTCSKHEVIYRFQLIIIKES